jgi:hypothetical protein
MPQLKTYDLFISHAWKYGDNYTRCINLLNNANNFKYRNYSAPKDKPLIPEGTTVPNKKILEKIENKIRPVNCFLVFAGMYSSYSDWIQEEINIALNLNKPIIVIKPWGQQRTPSIFNDIEMIGWNTDSIVKAIRDNSI